MPIVSRKSWQQPVFVAWVFAVAAVSAARGGQPEPQDAFAYNRLLGAA